MGASVRYETLRTQRFSGFVPVRLRHEQEYREDEWRAEFSRGEWTVADQQGAPVGLLGTTRDRNIPPDERYLEYLWVLPEFRRRGVASILINEAVQRLRQDRVSTLWLWVLDGNRLGACTRNTDSCWWTSSSR